MPRVDHQPHIERQRGAYQVTELARTGNQTLDASSSSVFLIQPNAALTLSVTGGIAGQRLDLFVEQTTKTSRTVTFGSGFKSTGTLATGTTGSRMFTLQFAHDGTNFYENSRTTAITVS